MKFETDISTSSLIGTDGTSTKFYKDDFFELVFINFDGSGNPERIINYYPNDPGIEIIENNVSSSWRCKHVK